MVPMGGAPALDAATQDIRVTEASACGPDLVQMLLDIDLQTFSEPTLTSYTAAVFLQQGQVFLLSVDGAVIGATVCLRSWADPTDATLLSMGIRPGWRGVGLGQRFVQGVLDRLAVQGLRTLTLFVGRGNRRALRVYEDVGFTRVGEVKAEPWSDETLVALRARLGPLPVALVDAT
jgi:ribosomal protein S18 acetylase RimI-like enzyme